MKIGAFAKKFKLNKSTVRYYSDIKLLIPKQTETYPDYDESCQKDMADILNLKTMGFTIEQIKEIKILDRFYVNFSESNLNHLYSILNLKVKEHKEHINQISEQIETIESYKASLIHKDILTPYGIPVMSLSFLNCPTCHEQLNISNAAIQSNQILSGQLSCSCGMTYDIRNGIIMASDSIADDKSGDKQLEAFEFVNKLDNSHIANIRNMGVKIQNSLRQWDHSHGIIFMNADVDVLLMSLTDEFKSDGHYLFCSYDYNGLVILKSKMERQNIKGHFTFIYFDQALPIRHDIPYLIDNVGNLFDLVGGKPIGYGVNHFIPLVEACKEWLVVTITSKQVLPEEDALSSYLSLDEYLSLFKMMKLEIKSSLTIEDFLYIDGMIEDITGLGNLQMALHKLISKDMN